MENIKIYCLTSQFNFLSFFLQIIFLCRYFFFFFISFALFSTIFIFCRCSYVCLDSAFTERILGLPNENFKGYVEGDATQRAKYIPSHSYFLIHGLADSSAPYLHGTQLARALAKAGVIFQYQVSKDNTIVVHGFFLSFICDHGRRKKSHELIQNHVNSFEIYM